MSKMITVRMSDDRVAAIDELVAGYKRVPETDEELDWARLVDDRIDSRGTLVKRGQVWWAEHPSAGRRPHLVPSRDAAIDGRTRALAVATGWA
jgi:hypothetical protein